MGTRTAENELEFLQTAPFEKWWFKVKEPSEQFTKLFNSLIDKRLFHIKLIRFMPGSGYFSIGQVAEIDEEGMWFLSHLFSNWQEMYEQAVPPWKREKSEQGEPEQEKTCIGCGLDGFNDLLQCETCQQWVCLMCWAIHKTACRYEQRKTKYAEQQGNMCAQCNLGVSLGFGYTCPECQEYFHEGCYHAFHAEKHRQETKRCPDCGKDYLVNSPTLWVTCSECQRTICILCYGNHRSGIHQPISNTRPKYKFNLNNFKINWDVRVDDALLQRYYTCFRNGWLSEEQFRAFVFEDQKRKEEEDAARKAREEAVKRDREEQERKARAREQAQRMYEKQQRKQEEFYKNLFGNMGHFSFKRNSNGTYTYTWDFGHWESDDDHQNTHCDPGPTPNTLEAAFQHLGLSTRATIQEVKRAFRRKAKEAHPDTGGSDAAFKELNEAYQKALAEAQRNER